MRLDRLRADAEARARVALLNAAARLPDVAASEVPGGIRLTAPGLVARAFGSRRRDRDPRLAAFLGGVR